MDKNTSTLRLSFLLAVLAGLPAFAAAADLDGIGRQLAQAARAAGLRRVAVARLEPARGRDDSRADALTEDMTLALVRAGGVQAVERAEIGKLAEELKLDRTGAVAGAADREARLSAVDALVVGRYEIDGVRMRVFARVVDAQTGVIVGAAAADFANDEDSPTGLRDAVASLPAPGAALAGLDCTNAVARLTSEQESLLELKARYWAFRMRLGVDGATASADALATIPDADQRVRYMDSLASWNAADVIAPLRPSEIEVLAATQTRAKDVVSRCKL
jgi:TolB-like protein